MQPELRHLRYLLAVAQHANFTRAAEELHISQPTLSQQIRQLEKTLGVQLLDRTGRSVRLTDAGAAYAHYARLALRELAAGERAVLDVRDLSRGHVRVGVTPTFTVYLVGPLVAAFHARYPAITVDLREMPQDTIESDLIEDRLDIGIGFDGPHLPGIETTELCTETLSLVAGPRHPGIGAAAAQPITTLSGMPLALLSGDFATRRQIDIHLAAYRIRPRVVVEANSITALIEIVTRSPLATVLPDAVTRDHPQLTPLALTPALPSRAVTLLRRETAYRSAAADAFAIEAGAASADGGAHEGRGSRSW